MIGLGLGQLLDRRSAKLRERLVDRARELGDPGQRLGIGAQTDANHSGAGDRRHPQRVPVGRLGDRAEALDCPPRDADRGPRPGHVGDRQAELARSPGEALGCVAEMLEPAQRVEEVVELLRVAEALALRGLGVDQVEPGERIRLGERQVDVQERVAVAELRVVLVAVVEADRDLRPERRQLASIAASHSRRPPATPASRTSLTVT